MPRDRVIVHDAEMIFVERQPTINTNDRSNTNTINLQIL